MSLITPTNRRGQRRGRGGGKGGGGGGRNAQNNKLYAHPLPLIFEPAPPPTKYTSLLLGLLGLSGGSPRVLNPHCTGYFDLATRSVWITDPKDAMILWRRGFFGKGDLSRSEPSWLPRQISARRAGKSGALTSEQIREMRRAERTQFKLERARAIAAAAAEAELVFAEQGRVLDSEELKASIPSAATWKPAVASASPTPTPTPPVANEGEGGSGDADDEEEEPIVDIEHLQLTLQEAFFLLWTMDCLTVINPAMDSVMSLEQIWNAFQQVHSPLALVSPSNPPLRPDNPFLVNYAVYHHYRSLGWVVKGGIKFCVDYLLYKRGPVFSHAEFAIVVIPVYENPDDADDSPFDLQNIEPFSWSWLSTINRVNSQVHKTLVLAYVTIPSIETVAQLMELPACLAHYSVREVVVRRFIPARMRD